MMTRKNRLPFFFGKYDKKKGYKAGLGVNYIYSDNTRVGFEGSVDPKNQSTNQVRIGGVKTIDKNCTVKGRFTIFNLEEFRFGLVYKQVLSSDSKLTFASDINANTLLNLKSKKGAKNLGHQFGVSLSFFD